MRVVILTPVQHGDELFAIGDIALIPDADALPLIKTGAAEASCKRGKALAAEQATAAQLAKEKHDLWLAEINEKATPKPVDFYGRRGLGRH